MNQPTRSAFLKEMGITEWSSRDEQAVQVNQAQAATAEVIQAQAQPAISKAPEAIPQEAKAPKEMWWFFGSTPQGDAQVLFQNIIRVLGLGADEWSWKGAVDDLMGASQALAGLPVVAFVFGGSVAQKLTGERDPLPQLRETVLGFSQEGLEEIPLVASFELNQLMARPKDKALLWRDLVLARSVLQNI